MADSARDYQDLSLAQIRAEFAQGRRKVLLWLATGSGKTYIFCLMIKEAVARGLRCIVLVRGRKLVDQASKRLFREGVVHGVMMAGHWNYRPTSPVQVCSIDTLIARDLYPEADLIIIDEADLFSPDTKAAKFVDHYKESFIVPVTATPWTKEGLGHLAETIVHPITMEELIEQKWLSGFKYYAPNDPDVSEVGVSKLTGDYIQEELEEVMISGELCGNVVEHWKRLAQNKPTILFGVGINHSKMLTERFNDAGIVAEHIDASFTDGQRNEVYERVQNGQTRIICNVGVAGRGVDVPCLTAVSMARPTKSRNLFIQQAGRVTRIAPGKSFALLLDHAGNIKRHGLPTDEPDVSLTREADERTPRETKICPRCFCGYRGSRCPECDTIAPESPRGEVEENDQELIEYIAKKDPVKDRLKALRKERGKRPMSWVYFQLKKEFGSKAEEHMPKYLTDPFASSPYSRGVKHDFIKKRESAKGSEA